MDKPLIQQTILAPYILKTIIGSGRTQVYALPKESDITILNSYGDVLLNLIMDIPTVVPEEPEKLRKKIKQLIIFS